MSDQTSTSPDRLDRVGALGGIGFTVLGLAATLAVPLAPAVDDPASEIRDYMVDNKSALGVSTVLLAASVLAFVGFVAMVHRRLSASGRTPLAAGAFLVSATACITLGLLGTLIEAVVVQRIAPVADDATVAIWFQVWDLVSYTGPPLAVNLAFAVAAYVMYRDRTFPRWLSAVAAASVALSLPGIVIDLANDGAVPAGIDLAGFFLANVWIIGLSAIVLLRSRDTAPSEAAEATATATRPVTA
jgi:hypothetical protein